MTHDKREKHMDFEEYRYLIQNTKLEDYSTLLNLGRKWDSIKSDGMRKIRVAFIGSTSIQLIVSVSRALLTKYGLYAEIYEGEYNGMQVDILDEESEMYAFHPEYIVLLPDYRDILKYKPAVFSTPEDQKKNVENAVDEYSRMVRVIHDRLPNCQIFVSNFVKPFEEPLGNLGVNNGFSQTLFFDQVNVELVKRHPPYVTVIDIERLSEYVGKRQWFDESAFYCSKMAFSLEYIGLYCDRIVRQIKAYTGAIKKCLVIDLDNTIWGGAVGDLGYDGIQLDPNDPEGEAYLAFQRYLKELKNRGVILAVCSKNDEKNAKEAFQKNPYMILGLSDVSAFVANWNDKVSNLKAIGQMLNIGTESMVFFDDNPTERMLVQDYMPEVKVIDVPEDPALYVRTLDQAFAFDWNQLTKEDIERGQTYAEEQERNSILKSSLDYHDFLLKLCMKATFQSLEEKTTDRFAQLTNKSNQFNLRTNRYTPAQIEQMMKDATCGLYTVSLRDQFSNYGIIACIVLRYIGSTCMIENWVMSCRVLKKTVEDYTMKKIVEMAREKGTAEITAEYIASPKNSMVKELYDRFGFALISDDNEKRKYVMDKNKMDSFEALYFMEEEK